MSQIITFLWVQRLRGNSVKVLSHSIVADISIAEVAVVKSVCEWLTERKREVETNVEPTAANGGDHSDILSVLTTVADQYGYGEYVEDCPTLAEYGISRTALAP